MTAGRPEGERPSAQIGFQKLYPPPAHRGVVARRGLLDRIFADGSVRVVLCQGPAGHGKSTVLQQAMSECQQRGTLTGWLSLDDADNDMRRFAGHFDALLDSVCGGRSGGKLHAAGVRARRSEASIARLLQLERPVALFLDEFQELTNPLILGFFRDLLERLPDAITVLIGSRALPDLGLARLLVNGRAMVLRSDDLRFSAAEAELFFAESRDLKREEIVTIHRHTEGWPAALQLFRLGLASPSVRQSLGDLAGHRPREVADYLADNVLSLQTPRIREFLLHTSLLTRLSAPLCDALLNWQDSQSILLFLERNGLFLRCLDSDLCWFRYHTLFSNFLLEQLREADPRLLQELHARAAHWYHAHGLHDEAMHHAVEAGEFGFAANVMNLWSTRLVAEGHLTTVERWYDRLPLDEIGQRRDLAVKIAYALSFLRRRRKLRPLMELLDATPDPLPAGRPGTADVVRVMVALLLDDVPRAFDLAKKVNVRAEAEPDAFRAFELSAACNVLCYRDLAACDYESARVHAMLSRAFSETAQAHFSGGYSVAVGGMNLLLQGQLTEALEHFRGGLAGQHADADTSVAAGSLVACYITALYDADELAAAEGLFAQFHEVLREGVLPDFLVVAYVAMVRIHDAHGASSKALELLDEAESICHLNSWTRLVRMIDRERVRRHLLLGERDRAQLIASRIQQQPEFELPSGWSLFSEDTEGDAIGQIRLLTHRGQLDSALQRIGSERALAHAGGRVRREIKLLILEALAQNQHGRRRAAYTALRHALELAAPRGFLRTFLEEGDQVPALLSEIYPSLQDGRADGGSQGLQGFAARLLGTAPAESASSATEQPAEALTDGEKNILVFLARGVSNKVMASNLFVSENTVKFHLKNIYGKLGVSSRLQAINAARRIGLV